MAEINTIIKNARDILVGKVPDPKAQIEQITIALMYKFMDAKDMESVEYGGNPSFFTEDYEDYAFNVIMKTPNNGDKLALYRKGLEEMGTNLQLPEMFRSIFKNAYLPYNDPATLALFLKEIDKIPTDNTELLGTAFEDLLSIMGSQGDAGQFRTPRHIIDFIVEVIKPQKNESILDPACGTAGFLVSAFSYINNHNDNLSVDDREFLMNNITGFDISPDMVRLAKVNLYLHDFKEPKIYEYDTLTDKERWKEKHDIILANPPFMTPKGGIKPHSLFTTEAKRSEVLFVDYIKNHLTKKGRAGVIVPEGIVFQSQKAYKELRKTLVEESLYAVVSLPSGVFNPYSGVKTSILLFDKTLAKCKDDILFVKMNNDGFDLGAQRRKINKNDIPDIISVVEAYQNGEDVRNNPLVTLVSKKEIAKQENILVGERYKATAAVNSKWDMVELGEVCEEIKNGTNVTQFDEEGKYRVTRIQTIADGTINLEKTKWTNNEPEERTFMKNGDILLSHINSFEHLGKSALFSLNDRVVHGINLIRFRPLSNIVLPKYLSLCMKSEIFVKTAKTFAQKAVNQASIKISDLKQIKIPLPPLSVQEEIVVEIEGYQKIIDGAKQVVENYKPVFNINPSWETIELGEICDINPRPSTVNKNIDVSFVPMSDLSQKQMFFNAVETKKYSDVVGKYTYFADNDVLLAKVTPCFENGKLGIAKNLINSMGFGSSEFFVIRPLNRIMSEWIYINLITERFILAGKNNMVGTGGLKRLQKNFLSSFLIPIPPIEIQDEIIKQIESEQKAVDECKQLIAIFEQKIKDKIKEVWGAEVPEVTDKQVAYKEENVTLYAARNASNDFVNKALGRE